MFTRSGSDYSKVLGAAFGLYICIVLFGQMSVVVDPAYLHEEQRALFRYHQLSDPGLFADDYLTSFSSAFPQPYLYDWLTRFWALGGGDLVLLHRLIPLVCWVAFLVGMAVVARNLGGWIVILGVVGVAAAQPIYLHQITSATPHAFAFPLLAWGLVAAFRGSVRGLAFVTLLSCILYVATVPLLGLMLAWQVLINERLWRKPPSQQFWPLLLLAVTGGLSLWLMFGSLRGLEGFGAALEPMQRVDVYPENGPDGRHFFGIFNPLAYVLGKAVSQFRTSTALYSLLLLLIYCLFGLYGLFNLRTAERGRSVLLAFVLCGVAIWLAVFLLKPFHSYRFVLYPVFTVMPLLFVVGLRQFILRYRQTLRFPEAVGLGAVALFALTFDGLDQKKMGYSRHLGPEQMQILAFAEAQPPDTSFAIWPELETTLEMIPYAARRPLFVMRKLHYPLYEGHLLTMREKMDALIDAYLATDAMPLRALHCRWGVDYLVVKKAHFQGEDERPRYFAPFDARIEDLWQTRRREDFLLSDPDPGTIALATEGHFVLQLNTLVPAGRHDGAAGCGPPGEGLRPGLGR